MGGVMVEAVAPEEVQRYGIVDCGGDEPRAGEARPMRGRSFDCGHIGGGLQANAVLAREAGYVEDLGEPAETTA
ncbi:hypothetical protein [Halomonas stenophila]|uniref:UTP-glucose-1-phosphate uridylyltransferase n=1 Tax=Halomonas stenophila TaxID=795312 RepID=A0A7W5ES34_9GAMM|nr:hypothetical protein [Halomonas stenophila]MBB3229770.1 UTP-glucose-1-phosphate uridylyltransferase [Halomonas stenophila]